QHGAAEIEHEIDDRRGVGAVAEKVAEIDQPVAPPQPFGETLVQRGEALRLAMDAGDRPDAPRALQAAERFGIAGRGRGHAAGRRLRPRSASARRAWWRWAGRSSRRRRTRAPDGRAPPGRSGARCRTAP